MSVSLYKRALGLGQITKRVGSSRIGTHILNAFVGALALGGAVVKPWWPCNMYLSVGITSYY